VADFDHRLDGATWLPPLQELEPLVLRDDVLGGAWAAAAAGEEQMSALRLLQVWSVLRRDAGMEL